LEEIRGGARTPSLFFRTEEDGNMAVTIFSVEPGSIAHKKGIRPGERLIKVNHNHINDVLDYRFYLMEKKLLLEIENQNGTTKIVDITKREYDDIGLEFETYLMDRQKECRNKCVFCFIDQLPKDLRESLYFKDDDSRLSFLFGNYITLTNLDQEHIDRIIKMRISPVNVSVHTTNPELRCRMMNNRYAGKSLEALKLFAQTGIKINCQLVLCRGINDGDELTRTLRDLSQLHPQLQSVACVPVGLTRFREGLYPLQGYDAQSARETLQQINELGDGYKSKHNTRLVYAADEFFLKAGLPLPDGDYYEDFEQLENGVGLCRLFEDDFLAALEDADAAMEKTRRVTVITGAAAYKMIKLLVDKSAKKWQNLKCNVIAIRNDFFGDSINVAGLVTGADILAQLRDIPLGDELLLPESMLRHERDMFLDSVTLAELEQRLGVKITPVKVDGQAFLDSLRG